MSQVCPSSSHQLVEAANAFRRARRKFPKNYGLCDHLEDTTESSTVNDESNDQENSLVATGKCSKPKRIDAKTIWNEECGESSSIKENLLQKPIICSCCRKCNEAVRANEPLSGLRTKDQCNAGDAFDILPSIEYSTISKKSCSNLDQEDSDTKPMKSFITEPRNSTSCRASNSHSRSRSSKETSQKLDSVNSLYDRAQDRTDNEVKRSNSSVKGNRNADEHCCAGKKSVCKLVQRNLRSKLHSFDTQNDNSSSNELHTYDFHCVKHSTLDLSPPHRDCCHSQNRHRCYHPHNCYHHCCDKNCSPNGKPRLLSDTCLCSPNSTIQKNCCNKHDTYESTCNHYSPKDTDKISTVQEQNDEDNDDCVGIINHKDSLCILVEKYKASKKCKQKKYSGETEFLDERSKDECNKSFTSDTTCQLDESVTAKQRDKYAANRFRDNSTIGKTCRHGCGQIFREGNCNQFKNLKSRLIKTGTCCSAKGTPWRHTF